MSLSPKAANKLCPGNDSGTIRPRVTLEPGRSLMDWINLTTKKLLASVRLQSIDEVELSKHNCRTDCWMLLGDKVYDITKYLPFHPGGPDELMRAAGSDGTALFTELHGWVNYEGLLKSCYVGRFTGDRQKLRKPADSAVVDDHCD